MRKSTPYALPGLMFWTVDVLSEWPTHQGRLKITTAFPHLKVEHSLDSLKGEEVESPLLSRPPPLLLNSFWSSVGAMLLRFLLSWAEYGSGIRAHQRQITQPATIKTSYLCSVSSSPHASSKLDIQTCAKPSLLNSFSLGAGQAPPSFS